MVHVRTLFRWNKKDLAAAMSPARGEFLWSHEDVRRVGKGAAEQHRCGPPIDQRDLFVEVENNRRAVGLVTEEEDIVVAFDALVVGQFFDLFGEVSGRKHGCKSAERDVGGDEKEGAGECDGDRREEMSTLVTKEPGGRRADGESNQRKGCGQAQRGKGWAGEIEEVGHG